MTPAPTAGLAHTLAPQAVADLYIACALAHNRPDMLPEGRREEQIRGDAILDVVRIVWGGVAAGQIIQQADIAAGCMEHNRPMCGGFLLELRE